MPTELLHREKIYCREWYNAATNEWFRLSIIPERKLGGDTEIFTPTGGFKLRKIPNGVLLDVADIENNIGELRIGIMDTPTIDIKLTTNDMPTEMKYIILNLENSTIDTDKNYTNTWILQSDRASDRATWYNEFIGVQRKTPGIKAIIHSKSSSDLQNRTEINLTLLNIGRAVLENIKMDSICYNTGLFILSGIGRLTGSGIISSYPASLYIGAKRIVQWKNGDKVLYVYPKGGATLDLTPMSWLFYQIWYEQQLMLRKLLRNSSIQVSYLNANGDRRFPNDNIKFFKQDGTTALNPDNLYLTRSMRVTGAGGTVIGGGLLDTAEDSEVSLAKYLNVFDFYKDISENFASALIYFNNINTDIETFPSGSAEITLITLPITGKLHYNFSRLKEEINKTDDDTTPFNITTAQRNINTQKTINDSIELEQGASLIRSCEATIDSAHLREDDEESFYVETDSIITEKKFEAKILFETNIHCPQITERGYKSSYYNDTDQNHVYDLNVYLTSHLYYADGTEDISGFPTQVWKVHPKVDFLTNQAGDVKTYDDVSELNTAMNGVLESFFTYDSQPIDLNASPDKKEVYRNIQNAKILELQRNYGLAISVSKYVLENFSKQNQSLIELSFDQNVQFFNNWLGDYFILTYWDDVDTFMPYVNNKATLLSIKQSRFSGKTEVKFLTEGN